ncbi:glycosyltransferase family 2 protein [Zymomonas mobilis]|uniref:glycosyltransferase family 2 protein n=1 Tax=Zymomonas mobilis TaxID=542 RepID=UPI0011540C8E|nr:glycosyltransferase [Zymomonas mobilis]
MDFNFFIVTVDASDQIRENWNRSPNLLNRIVHVSNIYDFSKIPKADVVVLLDSKCVPHPLFIPWISMAFCQKVDIVYCDQEIINDNGQKIVTRPNIDRIWIEQVNIIGNSLFISWDKWRNSPQIEVDKFISHLLKIDGDIHISHIPYPLLSTTKDFLDLKINFQTKIPQFFEKNSKSNSFSIIICTKNNSQDCLRMVNSINCKSSSKNEIEILVISNNTDNNEDIENLKKLNNIKNVRLYHDNGIFNWSYLNNKFAKMAKNKILLFCNDDMEILTENWDEIISQIINSSDTGIIGTKLIYKNNTIQHGGILFGWQNSVIHDGLFEDKNSTEQFARWQCTRKVSAVTGAFLAIRKDIFFEVGGFDDKEMPISYSDVDLCLKVKEKGLSVIWTPLIEVRHDESVSRGLDHLNNFKAERCNTERLALEAKWGKDTFSSDFSVHPMWLDATLPFRLLQPVSLEKALNYIKSYKL